MKIGIISSGNDTLTLRKILTKYDHEYLVYHDQTFSPFGAKDFAFILEEIKKAVSFLLSQWAEKIILDPVYELSLLGEEEHIFPLFTTYLQEYAFKHSLVGKIWILTDFGSADEVQPLLTSLAKDYQPIQAQLRTKTFSFPFSYRVKTATARPQGIADLGVHNPYLIRTLKNDLRYFKDANVDTLLPMHYHYFRMQRTIKGFFNFHKTRFHDLSVVEECFVALQNPPSPPLEKGVYSVHLRTNQDPKFLLKEKELIRLLQRGKGVELKIEKI